MKKSLCTLSHFYFFLKLLAQILLVHISSVDDDTLIQEIDTKWREGARKEGRKGQREKKRGGEGREREETERFTSTNLRRCFVQSSISYLARFFYRD